MSPQNTIWPHTISPSKRSLVLKLFSLLDSSSADSGPRLANEIFTPDGRIKNGTQSFTGRAGTTSHKILVITLQLSHPSTVQCIPVNQKV
ncbi:hypothetical protein BKA64DRAFT_666291 [Cadophora sp. MPI-SDFR-AT-0126]|nr:hypothetical protein BKA64DRAFT_666291 [Leotiomycetes sp. MPI-SDFR-AT-0126]